MNIQAYNTIIDTISPLLEKKELKAVDNETNAYFANTDQAIRVIFDEVKNVFRLQLDAITDGKPTENWKTISEWMFMPNYTEKDAASIGNDFYDTLNETLGLKTTVSRSSDIVVPTDSKDVFNLEGLLQRFLIIFPQYKDNYREHVEKYGECLYIKFFEEYAVPCLRSLLRENDKKRLKKYFDLLNEMYTLGDRNVSSVVSVVILGETLRDEDNLTQIALQYMEEYKYLKISLEHVQDYQKTHKDKNQKIKSK